MLRQQLHQTFHRVDRAAYLVRIELEDNLHLPFDVIGCEEQ